MHVHNDISLARGIMVGVWLESVFWGLHSGFVLLCIWVFRFRRRHLRGGVLTVTIIMYILASVHCFEELSHLINGFVDHQGDESVLTTYNTVNDVTRMMIYALNNSLSDAVVVWRCIVVWQRNWVACALPICLLLGMTVNGMYVTSLFATGSQSDPAFVTKITQQQTIFFAFSLATNFITTGFVAFRIWWLAHKVSGPGLDASRYNHVVAMLVESGLLYSSLKICELVLFVVGSNGFYIVFDSIVQIMCIAPTGIFIWVALGATEGSRYNGRTDNGGVSRNVGALTGASFHFARPGHTHTAMRATNTVGSGIGNGVTLYTSRPPSMVDMHELFKRKRDPMDEDLEMNQETSQTDTADSTVKEAEDEDRLNLQDEAVVRRASRHGRRMRLSDFGRSITMETTSSTLKNLEDTEDLHSRSRSSSSFTGQPPGSSSTPVSPLTHSPTSLSDVPENVPFVISKA